MAAKPYHHGDLRAALIDAGHALLAARDVEGLSLREVARTVGVSATAVYRHFPDKTALMAALARDGLDRLAVAQHVAVDAAGGGSAGFAATGRAYVLFALDNPALFRLIFTTAALAHSSGEPEAMRLLRAHAAASLPDDATDDAAAAEAIRAWAMVHGVAMLMLDGQIPAEPALIDALIRDAPPPAPSF